MTPIDKLEIQDQIAALAAHAAAISAECLSETFAREAKTAADKAAGALGDSEDDHHRQAQLAIASAEWQLAENRYQAAVSIRDRLREICGS